jgi:DNA-binding transcriptional LysR family regulator
MLRDFNDLQFFIAVVQNRGFSSGARALGVPKSRVSRRVALFEERLGVRLLDRGARGVSLTEIGRQVFEHARAALVEAEAAEEAALSRNLAASFESVVRSDSSPRSPYLCRRFSLPIRSCGCIVL